MKPGTTEPKGSWRSSTALVIFTATLGLFTENFLYGFIVPIISYMFEVRLRQDPKYTQRYASGLLFILGAISVPCAPLIGHLADKTANRKIPLLISLAGCVIGTVLVAATWSVWSVFVGRLFQGIAGTGAWIVAFAMLVDNIDKEHYGKVLGFTSSFIAAGILSGPAVAGTLLELFGYWPAWSVPFLLLAISLIARLVMTEKPKASKSDGHVPDAEPEGQAGDNLEAHERTGLLTATTGGNGQDPESMPEPKPSTARNFYKVMLSKGSVLAGLVNVVTFSTMVAAFDATFPLHLNRTFGWGPAPVGLIFLAIQIPGIFLAPVVGWLRDRVGLRWPTVIGWILIAPLMWFAGVPGTLNLPGLDTKPKCEAAFVACIISFGVVMPLVRGAGTFQNTITLREIQEKNPGIFGPHGGSSRLFAMAEISFNVGLMLGPIIGGALADTLGFYYMMFALAILSALVAVNSFFFLTDKQSVAPE